MSKTEKSNRLTALEFSLHILDKEAIRLDKLFAVANKIEKYLNGEVRNITCSPDVIIQEHKLHKSVFLNEEQEIILDTLNKMEDTNILFVTRKRGTGATTAILSYLLWYAMNPNHTHITVTSSTNSNTVKLLRYLQNIYNTVSTKLITDSVPELGRAEIVFGTSSISMVAPQVDHYRGRRINLAYFDNANYISYSVFNEILQQLRVSNTKLIISGEVNSDGPLYEIITNPSKYNFNIVDI